MKKNIITSVVIILVLGVIILSLNLEKTKSEAPEKVERMDGLHTVTMTFKDYGTITLELDGDAAPVTVSNFINLVKKGFYDGLTIHRVQENYVMQGGDPSGNGSGGADMNIVGEFKLNNWDNPISHKKGTISMARNDSDYDSASSQFFICLEDLTYLDGKYAAFGYIVDGMEVIDKIEKDKAKYAVNKYGMLSQLDQITIEKVTFVK